MNIVEVNYHDLLGRIFGGYDLHLSLNKIDGVSAVQYVALKGSDTPTVQAFCDDPVILEERRYLEHRFSISQLLSPYGLQLLEEPAFQEADVVHFNILHNDTLSLLDLPRLMERDNVVWTIHDPWVVTGNCIHPLECERWKNGCHGCSRLKVSGREMEVDNAAQMWNLKKSIFAQINPHIVVASDFTERYLRESPLTNHWNRITKIPFGIKELFFEEFTQQDYKRKFGLDPNELVIGFRQTKDPIKGCGYIYEALERLEIPYPVQLLAVGSESDLPDAIKKKYRYVSLPWLDEPDMLAYFRALDIFLMPSLAETFGLMSIEAMACETALICFQSTVLESVTNAPDYGIAVEYRSARAIADALTELIKHPEELTDRKRRGKEFVAQNYRYDTYVTRHLQLFRSVAACYHVAKEAK